MFYALQYLSQTDYGINAAAVVWYAAACRSNDTELNVAALERLARYCLTAPCGDSRTTAPHA